MTRLMDLKYPILVKEEWYIITSNDTEERIALPITIWRKLELLRKESQWTLQEGIKSFKNHHVESPWRTPVTKRMINQNEREVENTRWILAMIRWIFVVTYLKELGTPVKEKMNQVKMRIWWASGIRNWIICLKQE